MSIIDKKKKASEKRKKKIKEPKGAQVLHLSCQGGGSPVAFVENFHRGCFIQ